ncbi:MAG: hypothetical protein GY803_07235, partial [Chloroflexi bacterium]|nr:hypothetical protein [Chloroflexota bacterium]
MNDKLTMVGHFGGITNCIRVRGTYLFANYGSELVVFSIAQPEKPKRISQFFLDKIIRDIYLAGDFAVIAVYA